MEIAFSVISIAKFVVTQHFILYTIFNLGGIPPDGKPQSVLHKLLFPIIIVVDMLALLGILFAVVCLLFNILYRERK